jgi:hypothetical protein
LQQKCYLSAQMIYTRLNNPQWTSSYTTMR